MRLSYLLLFAISAILATNAEATPARRALIRSDVGAPPPDARRVIDALIAKLAPAAQLYGAALGQALEAKLTADAGPLDEADRWRKEIAAGRSRFIEGDYPGAIAQLEQARKALWRRQALLARHQGLREPLHQALLYLAHAYLRTQKNARALEVVGEAVRSFPDHHPALRKYAPELVQLYKRVSRDLSQQRKATLEIITDEQGCLAFVNGRYAGITPTKVPDLLPGRYAVYAQKPGRRGRIHVLQIAGSHRRLRIDFSLDSALVTRGAVGLRYASAAVAQRHEAEHASLLAQTVQADEIILVGYRTYQGRKALSGRVLAAATGRKVRAGMLTLDAAAPTDKEISAMARFLLSGERAAGIIVAEGGAKAPTVSTAGSSAKFFSARIWRWITLGLGVAAVGASVPLFLLHGEGTCDEASCPDEHNTLGAGIALAAIGGASLVTSAVLFLLGGADESGEQVAPHAALSPWVGAKSAGLSALLRF